MFSKKFVSVFKVQTASSLVQKSGMGWSTMNINFKILIISFKKQYLVHNSLFRHLIVVVEDIATSGREYLFGTWPCYLGKMCLKVFLQMNIVTGESCQWRLSKVLVKGFCRKYLNWWSKSDKKMFRFSQSVGSNVWSITMRMLYLQMFKCYILKRSSSK